MTRARSNGMLKIYSSALVKLAVWKFLKEENLNATELHLVRTHVYQYTKVMPNPPSDPERILVLCEDDLRTYIGAVLIPLGIDPF